ncbi:MAG TPA: RHS repeat-associated core domain-containing protein [Steroidobacteraceae bacterium]|nr:RHS repeat-associated core domain-containing protein [Steroidobacteraceae bacterium]
MGSNIGCGVYVRAPPPPAAQCGGDCNSVGDPINPASGAVYATESDVGGLIPFQRFFNSVGDASAHLGPGWTHSFSRSITRQQSNSNYRPYAVGAGNSSLYATEETACVSGFAQIKAQVSTWTNATASYSNGKCGLAVAGAPIGTLKLYYSTAPYPGVTTTISLDAIRDDGRVVSFTVDGSTITAPQGIAMRLQDAGNGFTLTDEKDNVETYDSNGKLITIVSRAGLTKSVAYDVSGRLSGVSDSFGHSIALGYDTQDRLVSVTNPLGGVTQYSYDAAGRFEYVTRPNSTTNQHLYEDPAFPNALTALIDENGARFATWTYDTQGRGTQTAEAGGVQQVTIAYNGDGSATTTDAFGAQRTFTYERHGDRNLVAGISGSKCATCREDAATSYDSAGFVSSRRDYNGNLTCYTNNGARGLELVRVEGFAPSVLICPADLSSYSPAPGTRERKIVTAWHATFRVPTSIVEASRTTSFTHYANGTVHTRTVTDMSVVPNVARTWAYTYDSYGRMLTEDGPRTDVADITTYTYHTCTTGSYCGQLQTVTNAAGQVTTVNTYTADGQPAKITDANGLITSLSYDSRQRLANGCVGATLPGCTGGELTHLDYWPTGLLKKVTNPDASYVQYTYDGAHRLTQVQDGALNKVVYTLDAMGNRTAENTYDPSNALKRTHSRVFNTLNQLWKDVNAAGTANVTTIFGYDSNGNQTTTSAPLSRNSTNIYDELNRLKQITDPNSGNTLFGYDANDNLSSVTDPRSLVTSYTYTGLGDLKTQVSPDTGTTTSTYDSGGNLKTSTDARSAVTTYSYDALNRVTAAEFKQGSTIEQTINYVYDGGTNGKGHMTGASDAEHTLAWNYDALGRVTGKTQVVTTVTPNVSKFIGYTYDSAGRLATILLPSGQTISYAYNSNGQVSGITLNGSPNLTILSNVTYDPFGPVTGWTWGNGTASTSRTFDTDGKLTTLSNTPATTGNRTFGFDDAFRVTSATDSVSGGPAWTFGYDILDRLNSATKTGTTIGYTYDADGNRLTQTGTSASTYTIPGTSNKLSSTTGALARTYTYDAVGNVLTTGVSTHTYNKRGRLRTSRLNSTTTNTGYYYNALGQRIRKNGGTPGNIYFVYDEAGHLVGEYTTTTLVQETVWLGDIPVATLRPKSGGGVDVFYVHTDQLNTPRKVTRPSDNKLRWSWDPTPFGEGAPNENPSVPALGVFTYNLRFPGQYFDVESNFYYNYFRDYDPAKGGYVQSDPIGLLGGLNTYGYVGANPLSQIDPTGEAEIALPAPGAVAGAVATAASRGAALARAMAQAASRANPVAAAGAVGVGIGTLVYPYIAIPLGNAIDKMCKSKEQNCRALYDTIIQSCWSIQRPRTRQRCFEAAKSSYEQCMAQD